MKCATCNRYPNPQTGGLGWYAETETRNLCPDCKPYPRCAFCNGSLPYHEHHCTPLSRRDGRVQHAVDDAMRAIRNAYEV